MNAAVRSWRQVVVLIVISLIGAKAVDACDVSMAFKPVGVGPDGGYTWPKLAVTATGGVVGTGAAIALWKNAPDGDPTETAGNWDYGAGPAIVEVPMSCRPAGVWYYKITGYCDLGGPPGPDDHQFVTSTGTFVVGGEDARSISAELLNEPTPDGFNVKVTYHFAQMDMKPFSIRATGRVGEYAPLHLYQVDSYSGEQYMKLEPGYTFSIVVFGRCFFNEASLPEVVLTIPQQQYGSADIAVTKITPGAPLYSSTEHIEDVSELTFALGESFTVGLRSTGSPTPLPSTIELGAAQVAPKRKPLSTATVIPKVQTVYGDRVLLPVGSAPQASSFTSVHLGSVMMTITPALSFLKPKTVKVNIVEPDSLGTSNTAFDEYFINVGHNTGLQPQWLKAQARQEAPPKGTLVADNWRYEPCGADLRYISDGTKLALHDDDFSTFRLDDAIATGQVIPIAPDDLDARNVFYVQRYNSLTKSVEDRHINNTDTGVTAREIWDNNNKKHGKFNFDTGCQSSVLKKIDAPNSTTLDFVAQTVTGSSYGLQQVMWDEARQTKLWQGVKIGNSYIRKPKYVFDRTEYINIGGGSLSIGANKTALSWASKATAFASLDGYQNIAQASFHLYNPYYCVVDKVTGKKKCYGELVRNHSLTFPPLTTKSIFSK